MDLEIETILQTIKRRPIPSLKEVNKNREIKIYQFYEYYFDIPKNIENYKNALETLQDYQYISPKDVELKDYIRYINDYYFYDVDVAVGGYVIRKHDDYITLINKNRIYKVNSKILFKRITEEDKAKMKLMELISEEKIDI